MNKELNLCELLKGHENETFWSDVFGQVTILGIADTYFSVQADVISFSLNSDGSKIKGERCIIFPSKDQRDWNKWAEEHNKPKIFDEIPLEERDCYTRPEYVPITLNKIQRFAIASIKIYQLIEKGYGGNVTLEEWANGSTATIYPDEDTGHLEIMINPSIPSSVLLFHNSEQATEFRSHPENKQLIRDFYMIP